MSSAIMEYLGWDSLGKPFYLLDTFTGVDRRYVTEQEIAGARRKDVRIASLPTGQGLLLKTPR